MKRTVIAGVLPIVASSLIPLSAPAAQAEPAGTQCDSVRIFGAAGSGELDDTAKVAQHRGVGKYANTTIDNLGLDIDRAQYSEKVSREPISYPAQAIPSKISDIELFKTSVRTGAQNALTQVNQYLARCGSSAKVVLVGYSQGAMAMHAVLSQIGRDPRILAAVLVADGTRNNPDTTRNYGTARQGGGNGAGIGPTLGAFYLPKLPGNVGSKTISVCNSKDPVCDTVSGPETLKRVIADKDVHDTYSAATWRRPLFDLVSPHLSKRTEPKPAESTSVPGRFAAYTGTWVGRIKQPGSRTSSYATELKLRESNGTLVGTVAYPELRCSGVISDGVIRDGALYVQETITSGRENCVPIVTIELRSVVGQLTYDVHTGSTHATGALLKVS
ncbi:cutinase family protein [Tsukamurella pseudospumae]|uniref:Cutinase n=1 Tax=Tsukamurella pseudospumae TaxID=239498 RepID=A0A138AK17_9ACTN|nr:cutinase family protein [Tsukamurella pseudospumae]KXP10841.1 hypothetical protein AXK60_06055 [Tsukamurella pseudospumae]